MSVHPQNWDTQGQEVKVQKVLPVAVIILPEYAADRVRYRCVQCVGMCHVEYDRLPFEWLCKSWIGYHGNKFGVYHIRGIAGKMSLDEIVFKYSLKVN